MYKPQYSQEALEKATSPERLDILFSPTTSLGWVALVSLLLMVFSGVFWSVFGVLSEKVSGVGLIANVEGIANITHNNSARVLELKTGAGQTVKRGELVAVLEKIDSEIDLANLQGKDTASSIRDHTNQRVDVQAAQVRLLAETLVTSPYNGTIIENKVLPGEMIQAGQALFAVEVESERNELIAVMYIPAVDNRKVKPGMTAQISISALDSEEQGYLLGRVTSVSPFPVSTASIMRWTGNKELADWLNAQAGNSSAEIKVALIKDESNPSGYMWSSVVGRDRSVITAGAVFTSTVVYKRQAPLTKAFLSASQWLRND